MKLFAFLLSTVYSTILFGAFVVGIYYAMPWLVHRGWFLLLILLPIVSLLEFGILYLLGGKILHNWRDISGGAYAMQCIIAVVAIIALCFLPWHFRATGYSISIAKCIWMDVLFALGSFLWFAFIVDGDGDNLLKNR